MPDLDRFEADLTALVTAYRIDLDIDVSASKIADAATRFIVMLGHAQAQGCDLTFGYENRRPEPEVVTPLEVPGRKLDVHVGRPVLPVTVDDLHASPDAVCDCGDQEHPHLWSDHAPTTPPCPKFVSRPGEFAAGPGSRCNTCGESGRAHGVTQLGPPTQIAETLTPLED